MARRSHARRSVAPVEPLAPPWSTPPLGGASPSVDDEDGYPLDHRVGEAAAVPRRVDRLAATAGVPRPGGEPVASGAGVPRPRPPHPPAVPGRRLQLRRRPAVAAVHADLDAA